MKFAYSLGVTGGQWVGTSEKGNLPLIPAPCLKLDTDPPLPDIDVVSKIQFDVKADDSNYNSHHSA